MNASTWEVQYKLFHEYWSRGTDNGSLNDLKTADQLRKKIIPQLEDWITEEEDKGIFASDFAEFADFLHVYFLLAMDKSNIELVFYAKSEMKRMIQRALELDNHCWQAHYWNVMYHLYDLSSSTLLSVVHKRRVSQGVEAFVDTFRWHTTKGPIDVLEYVVMTSRLFNVAGYCENINPGLARKIYRTIRDVDLEKIDYSNIENYDMSETEAREEVMKLFVLADSKV